MQHVVKFINNYNSLYSIKISRLHMPVNPTQINVNKLRTLVSRNGKYKERTTRVGTFEVCVSTHVALCNFIMQVFACQLHFLTNRNAELADPPSLWPVNCIKIGRHF